VLKSFKVHHFVIFLKRKMYESEAKLFNFDLAGEIPREKRQSPAFHQNHDQRSTLRARGTPGGISYPMGFQGPTHEGKYRGSQVHQSPS
jgi:hypothetical protein